MASGCRECGYRSRLSTKNTAGCIGTPLTRRKTSIRLASQRHTTLAQSASLFGHMRGALLTILYGHMDQSFYVRPLVRAVWCWPWCSSIEDAPEPFGV